MGLVLAFAMLVSLGECAWRLCTTHVVFCRHSRHLTHPDSPRCCEQPAGAASAAPATPARRLLGSGLGYIPQGCPLTVSVVAQESQPDWFQDAPEIRGSVTLSNPSTYNVPITNVIVQARSSDGMQYSTLAYCSGSTSTVVPFNPVPYTYGTITCNYRCVEAAQGAQCFAPCCLGLAIAAGPAIGAVSLLPAKQASHEAVKQLAVGTAPGPKRKCVWLSGSHN